MGARCAFPALPERGRRLGALVGMMKGFFTQIGQDILIWENKVYRAQRQVASRESPVTTFRRWAERSYPVSAAAV